MPGGYDDIDGTLKIPRSGPARDVIINFLLGVMLIGMIGLYRLTYGQNRELGEQSRELVEIIKRLDRMASDTDSEKRTRAQVHALILRQLGVKDAAIDEVLKDPRAK